MHTHVSWIARTRFRSFNFIRAKSNSSSSPKYFSKEKTFNFVRILVISLVDYFYLTSMKYIHRWALIQFEIKYNGIEDYKFQ